MIGDIMDYPFLAAFSSFLYFFTLRFSLKFATV